MELEDHRHCKVCGKPCEPDSETCSEACRKERIRRLQTRRGYTYLIYATIVLVFLLFVLSYYRV